jgi:putative inorganic carbon (hco3(-)) transporter
MAAAVALVAIAFADGGFFPTSWRWSTLLFAALAGIALLLPERIALTPPEIATLGAFAALAAWIALSSVWSTDSSLSVLELERSLVYVAAVAVLLFLLDRNRVAALLAGVLVASVALAVAALALGPPDDPAEGEGISEPIGYANGLGIFCVLGLLLAIGFAVGPWSRGARAAAALAAAPLVAAIALSGSRGAWVALALALPALVALRGAPRVGLALFAAAVAAVAVAAAGVDLGDRPYYWRAALEQYEEHPALGSGAGTFPLHWPEHRPQDLSVLDTPDVLDAHSLYLETLAELGPVGLGLLVAALGTPLVAALSRRRDPLVALALPPYLAYLAHAGLDWDWELPAVTLVALACAAGALVATRPGRRQVALSGPIRALSLAVVLAGGAFALVRLFVGRDMET